MGSEHNGLKSRCVMSSLTLAENVLRHSSLILTRTVLHTVLNLPAKTNQNRGGYWRRFMENPQRNSWPSQTSDEINLTTASQAQSLCVSYL